MRPLTFPTLRMQLERPDLPECFLPEPHLPLDLLRDLLNPQLVVLRQELQLLVNKPQPLLPLLPHFQAVNPERERTLVSRASPRPSQQRSKGTGEACMCPDSFVCTPGDMLSAFPGASQVGDSWVSHLGRGGPGQGAHFQGAQTKFCPLTEANGSASLVIGQ